MSYESESKESAHLHAALAEELVSRAERHLDNSPKLGELLGGIGLDVGNSLEIGCSGSARCIVQSRDLQMSILTICFQAVNLSMRMSEGFSS